MTPPSTVSAPATHHLLLIHGAWATPAIWSALTPCLEAEGFSVHAAALPGDGVADMPDQALSLQACVERLAAVIAPLQGPVSLIAHSGGGVIATALAEALAERITALVYIAGMMLPSGVGFAELVRDVIAEHPEAAGIGPLLQWNEARSASQVPPEAARQILFQDLNPAQAQQAAALLVPQPEAVRSLVAHWSAGRFGRLPRLYIEALQDRSVVPAVQRRMLAQVPGAQRIALDSGHAPQLSQPQPLAQAIAPFLRAQQALPHADNSGLAHTRPLAATGATGTVIAEHDQSCPNDQ